MFLGYGEGKKSYRCFDPSTHKIYVSSHVVFLEQKPFFSIPFATHDLTRSDFICIDNFSEDFYSLSSQVPNTSDSPSHVLPHFSFTYTRCVHASNFVGVDTLLFETPNVSSSPIVS